MWIGAPDGTEYGGQELSEGSVGSLAQSFVEFGGFTGAPNIGATLVRRIDRKMATFRVSQRLGREQCEFDISVLIEP